MSALRSRLLVAACAAVGFCAMVASPAVASFGIQSFEASYTEGPPAGSTGEALGSNDLRAGSHPYQFTASVAFKTKKNAKGETVVDGSVKELQVELPRGLVGDLTGIPQCSQATFMSYNLFGNNSKCPTDTRVGVLTINGEEHPLFNLVPPAGEAGQIGAVILIAPVIIDFSLRNGSDYGLTAELHDLSQAEEAKELSLALWGVPADSRHDHLRCLGTTKGEEESASCPSGAPVVPLLTMPTSCTAPLTTVLVARSWETPEVGVESSVTADDAGGSPSDLSGCERLHFEPSVTVQTESAEADSPTGLSVDVHVPYLRGPEELAEASLRNVVVALPGGLSLNPSTAAGLTGCTATQFALGQAAKPNCPDTSKIGTLEIQTPILEKPLSGLVYLAQPPEGLFMGNTTIYLAGEEAGLDFKLVGQLNAALDNGQLTLTLDELPELPLSAVRVDLSGGPRGAIANPAVCAAFLTTTQLTPYSTSDVAIRSSGTATDENCGGGFAPSFKAGATSSTAGQGTGFAIDTGRSDGQQYIQHLTVTLPPGVMANISSVPQCGDGDAAAGTCPATSAIGTAAVGAGAGPDPFYLNGQVYLTGPYEGAPFGISLVVPALAGPFNLGTIVVRGGIAVDLANSRITITTDPFPTILGGIPLRMKSVDLSLNRAGFMVNPTNCAAQATDGTLGSTAGVDAAVSAPFAVRGCAALSFAPKLAATTLAKASRRGNGASLDVKVSDPAGVHANLKSLTIKLPKVLKPRLTTIQQACLTAVFARSPEACPPISVVGAASVDTPLLNTPLTGPAYLVFHRGIKFPYLELVLRGDGLNLQIQGTVEVNDGISTTTFNALPDIPLSLFEVNLPEGAHSLLGATEDPCAKQRNMVNKMVGQNGAISKSTVVTAVEGCAASAAKVAARRRARASRSRRAARSRSRRAARGRKRGAR